MYGEHGFQLGVFVHRDGGVGGLTECEDQRDFFGSRLGGELNGGPERALFFLLPLMADHCHALFVYFPLPWYGHPRGIV